MTETGEDHHAPTLPDRGTDPAPGGRQVAAVVGAICPFLHAEGGAWRSAHPSHAHRCGAIEPSVPVTAGKQRTVCLAAEHTSCATYLAARERARGGVQVSGPNLVADLWPEVRSAPVLLDPPRGMLAPLASGPLRTGGQVLLVGLMALAFVVLVVARTSPSPGPGAASPEASAGGVGSVQSPTPAWSGSPAPSVSPTVRPTPSTTPAPAPSATPAPTPSASVQRYTVKSGDTLSGIAARFGTTVKRLKVANELTSTVIRPGQVLIIP